MNKMALFVEGYAELEFSTKLIQEIADKNSVSIAWRKITGGTTCRRRSQLIKTIATDGSHEHFVLVYDCGGDRAVKKRLLEEYEYLAKADYAKIICLRDVYPDYTYNELPQLERMLPLYVKTKPIVVTFVLQVMEIEAWFLAEHTHFLNIDQAIRLASIRHVLGFDPAIDDMQLRPTPAEDLAACYAIGGKSYSKEDSKQTVDALDIARVYIELVNKFPHLKLLCDEISDFLKG